MKIRKMTDSKLYQLGIQTLTDKLGTVGVSRFLNQIEPCTGDYAVERHEWLDKMDMETALREIEKMRQEQAAKKSERASRAETAASRNRKPLALRVQEMTDIELYEVGIKALVEKLSIAGMPRFIRLCAPGTGIYAGDRHKHPDLDEEINKSKQAHEGEQKQAS